MKRKTFRLPVQQVLPTSAQVLSTMGYPSDIRPREEVRDKLDLALETFNTLAAPQALTCEVSAHQFADIFHGEGRNDSAAPLGGIYPNASRLSLFVATLGSAVSEASDGFIKSDDNVMAVLLDAAASWAADEIAACLEREFASDQQTLETDSVAGSVVAMRYSPGYCGWHISSQHKLFVFCDPSIIGVTLGPSALMSPLKSVSGVFVAGPASIHRFQPGFEFCSTCKTRSCIDRQSSLVDMGDDKQ
jgi:Vitamin B12 dependent methionine synthase, activation domain